MSDSTIDIKCIEQLRDIPDLIPVTRNYFENWNIKVFNREQNSCKNYLSPNRRDFYKILFITEGVGLFSLGTRTYHIDKPMILFIHPNEIVSWKNMSDRSAGYYTLFKKRYIDAHPILKSVVDKYQLFTDANKSVICLRENSLNVIDKLFKQMHTEDTIGGALAEDAMMAYIQLIIIESIKNADFPLPDTVNAEFRHIHQFFQLLESKTSEINYNNPVKMKTAKEFADNLSLHPNHLNVLLKKYTGQNVSTHIKNRLLEESKALLLQTDWTLQEIGYCIGFADQPNFSQFFKKNIGVTPNEFRRNYQA
ncbi:AraC family transcriptional regulator [uncultured Bacteroides sp.]|uniref:AraC family transcriptional regulator n=1 Tax=uncultured Bacteroides sp. TaxID=162156 RepID=UPI002AA7F5A3|nr:AraC family transcriptional regulator [uncultured Bacteroides sp.]